MTLIGYDNAAEKYVMVTASNNQTFLAEMTGTDDDTKKAFLFETTMQDPVLKVPCKVRATITFSNDKSFKWESWVDYQNGQPEIKTLETTFTRTE